MVETFKGGGDTQTLSALIRFELFALRGSGDAKISLSCLLVLLSPLVPKNHLVKLSQHSNIHVNSMVKDTTYTGEYSPTVSRSFCRSGIHLETCPKHR